jgi:hypothetical protein
MRNAHARIPPPQPASPVSTGRHAKARQKTTRWRAFCSYRAVFVAFAHRKLMAIKAELHFARY